MLSTNINGKLPEKPNGLHQPPTPLMNPATGSKNPASSFSTLWTYIRPALDHIMRSLTNDSIRAPTIDFSFYAGIHSACYNYLTTQAEMQSPNTDTSKSIALSSGADLYNQLDHYFADVARELLLGAPQNDDTSLIHYIVPCFTRFSAGAQSIHRLLNYLNRHYVKRAVDEDRGWLRLSDVVDSVPKSISIKDMRERVSSQLKKKREEELRKWGYEGPGSPESATAEACVEAASPVDRVVPILSMAHRRFRKEFIEPLLLVPKVKGKNRGKGKSKSIGDGITGNGDKTMGPKGRLARATKEVLESTDVGTEERERLAIELGKCLRTIGVRTDHPLRKKLDKFAIDCKG